VLFTPSHVPSVLDRSGSNVLRARRHYMRAPTAGNSPPSRGPQRLKSPALRSKRRSPCGDNAACASGLGKVASWPLK